MIYLRLFFEFFKTGLFALGGGLATLPFLYEMAEKTGWFTAADVADMIAVSESTPGAIGINMATFAGFKTAGVSGGLCATLGLAAPSIIIILIVAQFLNKFRNNPVVDSAFNGLRPASMAMITAAGLNVVKIALVNMSALKIAGDSMKAGDIAGVCESVLGGFFLWKGWVLAVFIYVASKKLKWHAIIFIALSAFVGILFRF